MKEKVFNVGYTSYFNKKNKWTSIVKDKIMKNKMITLAILIVILSIVMNFILIYNFVHLIEKI